MDRQINFQNAEIISSLNKMIRYLVSEQQRHHWAIMFVRFFCSYKSRLRVAPPSEGELLWAKINSAEFHLEVRNKSWSFSLYSLLPWSMQVSVKACLLTKISLWKSADNNSDWCIPIVLSTKLFVRVKSGSSPINYFWLSSKKSTYS